MFTDLTGTTRIGYNTWSNGDRRIPGRSTRHVGRLPRRDQHRRKQVGIAAPHGGAGTARYWLPLMPALIARMCWPQQAGAALTITNHAVGLAGSDRRKPKVLARPQR